MNWIKGKIRQWLEIGGNTRAGLPGVLGDADFDWDVLRNMVWYRGVASELAQYYQGADDMVGNRSFWAVSAQNSHIRKMHSGLPALIVDTISDICADDLLGVVFDADKTQTLWDKIAAENNFGRLLKNAIRKAVALGDGAFRISFDPDISQLPIIEFFSADRVRFNYRRGRVCECIFVTQIAHGDGADARNYELLEIHSPRGVDYQLKDWRGEAADLGILPQTKGLSPIINEGGYSLAIPLIFDENPRAHGRGKSIFDGKIAHFDALDEALSQWVDALRDGRAAKYIPIGLMPRDPNTGAIRRPGAFDSRYIQTEMDLAEGAANIIQIVQADINTTALSDSVLNFIEMALQGIIAPATLGIDTKRRDNAEAMREKEKATLYTRNKIIATLRDTIAILAQTATRAHDAYHGHPQPPAAYTATAEFGEYGSPDFDTHLDTISRGVNTGIISIQTAIDQLYGNTWTPTQKSAEVARLLTRKPLC